jgi:hypothetical protein
MMARLRRLADLTAGLVDVPGEITVSDVTLDSRSGILGLPVPRLPRRRAPRGELRQRSGRARRQRRVV